MPCNFSLKLVNFLWKLTKFQKCILQKSYIKFFNLSISKKLEKKIQNLSLTHFHFWFFLVCIFCQGQIWHHCKKMLAFLAMMPWKKVKAKNKLNGPWTSLTQGNRSAVISKTWIIPLRNQSVFLSKYVRSGDRWGNWGSV